MGKLEPPNKLLIVQLLGCFGYDSMIPNGLTRIFSGATCVIRGVLGQIGVIWRRSQANDGDAQLQGFGPYQVRLAAGREQEESCPRRFEIP